MLRTQEAALYGVGAEGIAELCEAMCIDALDVTAATRASVWFFQDNGDMVCQHLIDGIEGRIQRQGAIIPQAATEAYIKAARAGITSMMTEEAPSLDAEPGQAAESGETCRQIDLLIVDDTNIPTAVFRCERAADSSEWGERDLVLLRKMAQILASTIRRECREYAAEELSALASFLRSSPEDITLPGSRPLDLKWLQSPPEAEIRLPEPTPAADLDMDEWEPSAGDRKDH